MVEAQLILPWAAHDDVEQRFRDLNLPEWLGQVASDSVSNSPRRSGVVGYHFSSIPGVGHGESKNLWRVNVGGYLGFPKTDLRHSPLGEVSEPDVHKHVGQPAYVHRARTPRRGESGGDRSSGNRDNRRHLHARGSWILHAQRQEWS